MNELLSLFPVLFLVYILQCVAAAPAGTAVFLLNVSMRGRVLRHFWQVGKSQHRVFLLNPFVPSSSAVYVCGFPFSFVTDPAGEVCGVAPASPLAGLSPTWLTFAPTRRFTSRSKQLLSDDSLVASLHSETQASRLAALLEKLQSATPLKRRALIDQELQHMFDLKSLRERLEAFAQGTVYLDSLCLCLFLFLFLLAPAAIYKFGLRFLWPELLVILIVFCSLTLWAFRRARRRLYPKEKGGDFQHLFTIALSPFAAIRAIDHLAGDLLEDFHPVAVAFALLAEKDYLKFAERELRRTKFIARDLILEKSISGFLSAQKFDPHVLLKPPMAEDGRSRTYCPACLTQYVLEEGTCLDCGEVPLEPVASGE